MPGSPSKYSGYYRDISRGKGAGERPSFRLSSVGSMTDRDGAPCSLLEVSVRRAGVRQAGRSAEKRELMMLA